MTNVDDLIADLSRLNQTATTPRRDVSPEDSVWFFDHPLRKALTARGINTVGVAAAAVIEWLELTRDEGDDGRDYRINPPTDPAAPENRPAAT
jgi:hypothetical protein